jgi:hypothetical protein
MSKLLSALERNILKAKGLTDDDLKKMTAQGIRSKEDFRTVGDAATLSELIGVGEAVAEKVMRWAIGQQTLVPGSSAASEPPPIAVPESGADTPATCFWCSSSGAGRFCRKCGAEFVPTGELELALLLKREGIPKQDISTKLRMLSSEEKEQLWGRVRRYQG